METKILGKITLPKNPKRGVNYLQLEIDKLQNECDILENEIFYCSDLDELESLTGHFNALQTKISNLKSVQ